MGHVRGDVMVPVDLSASAALPSDLSLRALELAPLVSPNHAAPASCHQRHLPWASTVHRTRACLRLDSLRMQPCIIAPAGVVRSLAPVQIRRSRFAAVFAAFIRDTGPSRLCLPPMQARKAPYAGVRPPDHDRTSSHRATVEGPHGRRQVRQVTVLGHSNLLSRQTSRQGSLRYPPTLSPLRRQRGRSWQRPRHFHGQVVRRRAATEVGERPGQAKG